MADKKDKSKVPDLSKEDPGEEVKKTEAKTKEVKEKKPRYVTVEKTDEDKKPEVKDISPDKPAEGEDVKKEKLTPSESDVKVTPSFSLLDADKKTSKDGGEDSKEEKKTPELKIEPSSSKPTLEPIKAGGEEESPKKDDESNKEVKKWLSDTPITEDSGIEESSGIGKKLIFIVLAIMVIAGVLGGGFYYYKNNMVSEPENNESDNGQIVVRDANDVTPTPTPEESEEVDLAEYTVSVLNGSGIIGEAGVVSELLIDTGFNEPDTGNAESYDYESTQVSLKPDIPNSVFDTISDSLSGSYDVSSVPAELEEDSSYDIIVIVGSAEPEPEPTATPTPEELEE